MKEGNNEKRNSVGPRGDWMVRHDLELELDVGQVDWSLVKHKAQGTGGGCFRQGDEMLPVSRGR